jgi:hypothetical protein
VQLSAAWVRRKRFEAGLLAQALAFLGMGGMVAHAAPKPAGRDAFWDLLTSAATQVVDVEPGAEDGHKAG